MKQLAWGDVLCGVKVTPMYWCGGVICNNGNNSFINHARSYFKRTLLSHGVGVEPGTWGVIPWETSSSFYEFIMACSTPIYPPRGFAGLSEAELLNEMIGYPERGNSTSSFIDIRVSDNCFIAVDLHNPPTLNLSEPSRYVCMVSDELILALQNAQVLSRRLRGE